VLIVLDGRGRLQRLTAATPHTDAWTSAPEEANWSALFEMAELDIDEFQQTAPTVVPPVYADDRLAWKGRLDGREVRIEAASHQGKPVSFRLIYEWNKPRDERAMSWPARVADVAGKSLALLMLAAAVLLARRNLVAGRADRKGAFRLSVVLFFAGGLQEALAADSLVDAISFQMFPILGFYFWMAGIVFVLYVALEPLVRRCWPQTLISWSRLLSGHWLDARVGRDVVIGLALGTLPVVIRLAGYLLSPEELDWSVRLSGVLGSRYVAAGLLDRISAMVVIALITLFGLLLLRLVLRKPWVAAVVFVLVFALVSSLSDSSMHPISAGFSYTITGIVWVVVLTRCGALAIAATMFYISSLIALPMSADPSTWYFEDCLIFPLVIAALAILGCYTSITGWWQAKQGTPIIRKPAP
jgi:hypothetical protein